MKWLDEVKGVTKTSAISPASKTPAQPCLFLRKRMLKKIYENTRSRTKELDNTRSKDFIIKKHRIRNEKGATCMLCLSFLSHEHRYVNF